jgi:hypothetical protein
MREAKAKNDSGRNDMEAAKDCITRAAESSWWDWLARSRPFHWRWPEEGLKLWYKGKQPTYMQPQRPESDPVQQTLMVDKLLKVLERRYFEYGDIASLTQFFKVSKGECDIRMVYNGTSSGLNDWLWVPWFPLPTITTLARSVEVVTHVGDLDVGEMFLNFILEMKARVRAGVDLTHFIAFSENVLADKETPRTTCGKP